MVAAHAFWHPLLQHELVRAQLEWVGGVSAVAALCSTFSGEPVAAVASGVSLVPVVADRGGRERIIVSAE
jgi:hypothetical protein